MIFYKQLHFRWCCFYFSWTMLFCCRNIELWSPSYWSELWIDAQSC